ncbi:MAG: carbohydrate-binding domain-containing protein, partial [Janthinobacterium lividum]
PGVGDRNLYVEGITLGGVAVPVSNGALYSNGAYTTAVTEPTTLAATAPTPTPTPVPTPVATPTPITTDTLTLNLSEDAFQGDAQFIVSVDGKALGAAQSVTAQNGAGASQAFTFTGQFGPGAHNLAVSFTNDLWNPGVGDRNLYVKGATFDGASVPVSNGALYANGSWTTTVTTPTNAVTVPTVA